MTLYIEFTCFYYGSFIPIIVGLKCLKYMTSFEDVRHVPAHAQPSNARSSNAQPSTEVNMCADDKFGGESGVKYHM